MANPLFPGNNTQVNNPFSNMMDMMNQFNQFKSTFQGDPRQKVEELLSNGQMSKEQFEQLSNMANTFKSFMR